MDWRMGIALCAEERFNEVGRWTMNDNVVSTLAPQLSTPKAPASDRKPTSLAELNTEKQALFDSIASEGIESEETSPRSPLKSVFTGMLWFGYSVAVVVALILVWSAANGLIKAMPR